MKKSPNLIKTMAVWVMLFCCSPSFADSRQLEVIALQHRPADLILPALYDVASSDTQLTANGNQLIVRATVDEMAQLKLLIQQLDQPLAQFRISVRQQGQNTQSGSAVGGSYQYNNPQGGGLTMGRTTLDGRPLPSGSARIQSSGSNQTSSVTVKQYNNRSNSNTNQQLRAVEGYPAYIEAGQQIPITTRYQDRYGSSVEQNYQPVVTGFYVTPTLSGNDRVTLDISTSKQSVEDNQRRGNNPTIKTAGYHSTITAPLGQWVDLGSTFQGGNSQSSGIADRQNGNSTESLNLQLKIERSY